MSHKPAGLKFWLTFCWSHFFPDRRVQMKIERKNLLFLDRRWFYFIFSKKKRFNQKQRPKKKIMFAYLRGMCQRKGSSIIIYTAQVIVLYTLVKITNYGDCIVSHSDRVEMAYFYINCRKFIWTKLMMWIKFQIWVTFLSLVNFRIWVKFVNWVKFLIWFTFPIWFKFLIWVNLRVKFLIWVEFLIWIKFLIWVNLLIRVTNFRQISDFSHVTDSFAF